MMKILLTGGSGMVGRNICEHPSALHYNILAPSSRELNLLDAAAVNSYVKHAKPDLIIHAAGIVGGIQANIAEPMRFLHDNMKLGLNVIMSAQECRVKTLLNIASSCMYPRGRVDALREGDILSGALEPTNEGYALAKIAAVRACEYVCREDPSLHYKSIIPCNLYGRFDKFDPVHSHMIPAVIRKIFEAKEAGEPDVEIWGDGKARREFMYAGDLADFVFYALERLAALPQNLNVGLGVDFSIEEYYRLIANSLGYGGGFKFNLARPVGMQRKLLCTKNLEEFGWTHSTTLQEGVDRTIQYFRHGA